MPTIFSDDRAAVAQPAIEQCRPRSHEPIQGAAISFSHRALVPTSDGTEPTVSAYFQEGHPQPYAAPYGKARAGVASRGPLFKPTNNRPGDCSS